MTNFLQHGQTSKQKLSAFETGALHHSQPGIFLQSTKFCVLGNTCEHQGFHEWVYVSLAEDHEVKNRTGLCENCTDLTVDVDQSWAQKVLNNVVMARLGR